MNKILKIIMFVFVFLTVYFSLNYYVFFRMLSLFTIKRTLLLYVILAFLSLYYIIASVIVRVFHNIFSRAFYTLSSVYMGVLFFTFFALLVYEIFRLFIDFNPRIIAVVIIFIVILISSYSTFNALSTKVKTVEINDFGKKLRFVQLSDVHVGTIKNSKYLTNLVSDVNDLNPDFVLITGDLVDGSGPLYYNSYSPILKLNAKTFFVYGNHESYEGLEEVKKIIEKLNLILLQNEVFEYKGIFIAGVDFTENKNLAGKIINELKINDSKPSILMSHLPIGYTQAEQKGIDLMLSGHTHNGQIYPFNLFVRMAFKYINGLNSIGKMKLYVSPGTSTWGPPMRLGSKNEITLFVTK